MTLLGLLFLDLLDLCDKEKRTVIAKDEEEDKGSNMSVGSLSGEDEQPINSLDEGQESGEELSDEELEDIIEKKDEGMNAEDIDEVEIKEDIYGRKINPRTGKVIENFTIAGAKAKLESLERNSNEISEKRIQIEKQIRGIINRYSSN
jgi:hypothetical protein